MLFFFLFAPPGDVLSVSLTSSYLRKKALHNYSRLAHLSHFFLYWVLAQLCIKASKSPPPPYFIVLAGFLCLLSRDFGPGSSLMSDQRLLVYLTSS